jgi:type IX secretion system PorP/SprF family membrane protein
MKHIKISKSLTVFIAVITAMGCQQACAQLTGLQTMFYQNQYLANPAMAGLEKGLNLNLGYQQQWTSVPGGPRLQNFTADYNSGDKVGLGLNVNSDAAGLINRTRIMGTYAYHLPLNNDNNKLNFGVSFGLNETYIDYTKVNGDQGDAAVQTFNQRSVYADGDFGIAYTTLHFNVQAAVPNLKSVFFNGDVNSNLEVDRATFYSAVSYKLDVNNGYSNISIEPKVAFRGVKGFDNILDAGAKLTMNDYGLDFTGMYHTSKSASFAVGIRMTNLDLLLSYSNNTGPLSVYANNTFEFGVKLKLFNK